MFSQLSELDLIEIFNQFPICELFSVALKHFTFIYRKLFRFKNLFSFLNVRGQSTTSYIFINFFRFGNIENL